MIQGLPYNALNKTPLTCFTGLLNSRLHLVNEVHEWEDVLEWAMRQKVLAVDTETNGFLWFAHNRIVGVSLGYNLDHVYIPVRHENSVLGGLQIPQLSIDVIRPGLQKLLSRKDLIVVGHNIKFDRHFLRQDGIDITSTIVDTRVMLSIVDENAPGALKDVSSGWTDLMGLRHSGWIHSDANADEKIISAWRSDEVKARKAAFKALVAERVRELSRSLEHQSLKITQLKAMAKAQLSNHPFANPHREDVHYGFYPALEMTKYAALDTFLTYRLYAMCLEKLRGLPECRELFINECKLANVLYDIEAPGMYVDVPYYRQREQELLKEEAAALKELEDSLGVINFNSADQLAAALMRVGVTLTKETKSSSATKVKYCLNKTELVKLAKKYPIVMKVLEYRKIVKTRTTYIEPLINKSVLQPDGTYLAWASFNQSVVTGRMSVGGPTSAINFQTLPRKEKSIKRGLIVPPGGEYLYGSFDYSQVEVRLTAHFSECPILMRAYVQKDDAHLRTACAMFGWDYDATLAKYKKKDHPEYGEISEYRTVAKTINFAIVYSVSARGLSEQIPRPARFADLSEDEWVQECERFIALYFSKHRAVAKFIFKTKRQVHKDKQIVTPFGRIRRLPHIDAVKLTGDKRKAFMEASAERQSVNVLPQGTAADIFKYALVRVHKLLQGTKSRVTLLIHDDISFYLHKSELHLLPKIKHIMEDFNFRVPIVADFSVAQDNLSSKHETSIEELMKEYA